MSTDQPYPYVTDPTAVMAADTTRCLRCGTHFASHGGRCGQAPNWRMAPRVDHDESRAVTPFIRGGLIWRDAGQSDAPHTRFFAGQLLAAADALDAMTTPPVTTETEEYTP